MAVLLCVTSVVWMAGMRAQSSGGTNVDRSAFLEAAEVAFNKPLRGGFMMGKEDRDLRAVLLLAYRKLRRY